MIKEEKEKKADEDTIVVGEVITIENGKHEGVITNLIRKLPNKDENRPYDYLDISITLKDTPKEIELKAGFPTNISELSTLGRFLKKSGFDFEENDEIKISNIKEHLIDQKVTLLTKNEKTEAGEFARILRDTIKFVD